jgi:hypothetical protein
MPSPSRVVLNEDVVTVPLANCPQALPVEPPLTAQHTTVNPVDVNFKGNVTVSCPSYELTYPHCYNPHTMIPQFCACSSLPL